MAQSLRKAKCQVIRIVLLLKQRLFQRINALFSINQSRQVILVLSEIHRLVFLDLERMAISEGCTSLSFA